jgi:hypothetical protein
MAEGVQYPHQAAGKVGDAVREQMTAAIQRFGVTDGALVRMALEDFLPRYLAAQGRGGDTDLIAQIGEALKRNPALKGEIEALIRKSLRNQRRAAA